MTSAFLKVIFAAALATLPATVSAQSGAMQLVTDDRSVIAVQGSGKVKKAPDVAEFRVAVFTVANTAEKALQENAEKMQKVFGAIEALGIAQEDVQTSRVGVEPQFESRDRNSDSELKPREIVGYGAANMVSIKYRKLDDFGGVIDSLVAAGANSVTGPTFALADNSKEVDEARIAAVKNARSKADLYANAAGMKVSRLLLMVDDAYEESSAPYNQFGFMEAMSSTPIAAGEVTVSASVKIMFELQPR